MRIVMLCVVLAVLTASTAVAQTPLICEPLRYFNATGQDLVYTESMPSSWWGVRMTANWKADVDTAFVSFGVARATSSGLTPDTLDLRILKDQLPQQVILDQLTVLIPPNLQGNVPDAYYIVEFRIDEPVARIDPTPADFWLSWRLRGPTGDQARIRLKTPAANPRRSVTIGAAGDTLMATLAVKAQLGLGRQDSVDLWAEARVCYPDGIPVELSAFTATYADGTALLQWRTAGEENNMGFYVERRASASGSGYELWQEIGFVPGHGTTTRQQEYRFTDRSPSDAAQDDGLVRYRLRQVDYDGRFEISPTVDIHVPIQSGFVLGQNYPNPATLRKGQTTVAIQLAEEQNITLVLYDALGRRIRTIAQGQYRSGRHFIEVPLEGLRSGTYYFRLTADTRVQQRRMIVT
ncbi:MAG: T9SS type A sorting domain-containing protein, partial [Bacteroidota bacterium]|nr:T9SS type A sorting domain-containing protein [Bacteroidota bacterium]